MSYMSQAVSELVLNIYTNVTQDLRQINSYQEFRST